MSVLGVTVNKMERVDWFLVTLCAMVILFIWAIGQWA